MMKWIFALLLLGNMVFFAVMQWGGALTVDESNPQLQAALNADKIKIVNLLPSSAPVPASAVLPASSVPAIAAASAPVSVTVPAPVVAAPAALPPPLPVPPVIAAVAPPAKLSCMEWGEFSGADLRRADKALAAIKLGDKAKPRIVEYNSAYWVYIVPMKMTFVKKKIAQLKKLKIQDYFVVKEPGDWKNSISLGVFKSEEAAKKYLAKVRALGVKGAKTGERASKLKFTVLVLNRLDSAASSQVSALRKDFPDTEIKQISCN
jgi:hypothetical protein